MCEKYAKGNFIKIANTKEFISKEKPIAYIIFAMSVSRSRDVFFCTSACAKNYAPSQQGFYGIPFISFYESKIPYDNSSNFQDADHNFIYPLLSPTGFYSLFLSFVLFTRCDWQHVDLSDATFALNKKQINMLEDERNMWRTLLDAHKK